MYSNESIFTTCIYRRVLTGDAPRLAAKDTSYVSNKAGYAKI